MYRYLREEGYYSDLYDLGTIVECIRIQEYWKKVQEKSKGRREKGYFIGIGDMFIFG